MPAGLGSSGLSGEVERSLRTDGKVGMRDRDGAPRRLLVDGHEGLRGCGWLGICDDTAMEVLALPTRPSLGGTISFSP